MSHPLYLDREISADSLEDAIARVEKALQEESFGVLTRIDLHTKIKEKLGKQVKPTTILGACNPALAYQAYQADPAVTALLPCNAVICEEEAGSRYRVELTKPSALFQVLGDLNFGEISRRADTVLEKALNNL